MEQKRSIITTIIQIVLLVVGFIGLVFVTIFFLPIFKLMCETQASFGEAIGSIFSLLLQIIYSPIPIIAGLILTIVSIYQLKKRNPKDRFEIVMLILGIVIFVLPFVMFGLLYIV